MTHDDLKAVLRTADAWAADLLLSALAAAAGSKRRVTCTAPFPTAVFEAADGRDYSALLQNLQDLPPASSLAASVDSLSQQQAALLHWLLTHPKRPVESMRRCTLRQMQEQMPALTGWMADIGRNPGLKPHAVLQLGELPTSLRDGSGRRLLCFHGTSMDNMHSILHFGLMNASGTRLQRTGHVFGKGIYFSSEPHVAFAFSLAADGWQHSTLGGRLRCMLACSVAQEHVQGAHNTDLVPDRYLIVEQMDAVQIHFVFVYADSSPSVLNAAPPIAAAAQARVQGHWQGQQTPQQHSVTAGIAPTQQQQQQQPQQQQPQQQQPQQRSPLVYIVAAYLLWLLLMSLQDHWPFIRRFLRRKLGIRF